VRRERGIYTYRIKEKFSMAGPIKKYLPIFVKFVKSIDFTDLQ
jgi:hypothetical protein